MYELTCHSCGKVFESRRSDRSTCSGTCRQRRARTFHRITGEPPVPGNTKRLPIGRELVAQVQPVAQVEAPPAALPAEVEPPRPKRVRVNKPAPTKNGKRKPPAKPPRKPVKRSKGKAG